MLGQHPFRPYPETRFASSDRKRAVPLLVSAGELIAPTGELTLWIMGEPAQLLFHFPAELLPVAFETILIQLGLLLLSMRHVKTAGLP